MTHAVEDELLPANPALRLGRYLRSADDPEPIIDPFTRDEAAHIVAVARQRFPEWHPWLLCGLRTGMRAGELLALQWGDFKLAPPLRPGAAERGAWHLDHAEESSTPARRFVAPTDGDAAALAPATARGLVRRRPSVSRVVFSSVTGTALDESNVRKAFNRILDGAGVHRRGPHQMRHTFARCCCRKARRSPT